MDTFGSVDAYARVAVEGSEYRTQTIKNSYSPEWNETFAWNFGDIQKGCRSDFVVQVNDWDATSKDDEVGSFTIPASRMSEILRAKIGWEGQETFTLYREGKGVVGQDKELSEVTIKVCIVEVPKAFATLEVDEGAKGSRRLLVTIESAKHLPKVQLFSYCAYLLDLLGTVFQHASSFVIRLYVVFKIRCNRRWTHLDR
jgi:hypothetical protein